MHKVDSWVGLLGNNALDYLQMRGFILLKDISDGNDSILYQVTAEIVKLYSNLVRRNSCDSFEYV